MPSVDVSSGTLTGGSITVGHQFQFSTNASGNISVSTKGGAWFSPSPASFTGPGSVTVTAELTSSGEGWSYGVTGMNVINNNPHVPVKGAMPAHAKAS
jgi:hypothetical protein